MNDLDAGRPERQGTHVPSCETHLDLLSGQCGACHAVRTCPPLSGAVGREGRRSQRACHARTPFLIPPTESSNGSAHVPVQGTWRYFPSRCWTWKLGLHASNRNADVDEMPQLAHLATG